MSNEKDTQTGIIGLFDILGYQNLLEKNEPEDIAKTVIPFLTGIGPQISAGIEELHSNYFVKINKHDPKGKVMKAVIRSIKWLVFSDTILITMPDQGPERLPVGWCWVNFLLACHALQKQMFKNGLPVRGVVTHGKYYIKDMCFAGRPIIEAYQLCKQLEFAACVLTKNARCQLDKQEIELKKRYNLSFYGAFVCKYHIPTKTGESNMLTLSAHTYDQKQKNLKDQVLSSFWGHNKDIPISAQVKIANTEQWLRYLRMTINNI